MDRCLGCRACETACPAGVPFGRLLEETRGQIERLAPRPLARRLLGRLVLGTFPDRRRMGRLLRLTRLYQRSGLQRAVRASGLLRSFRRLAAMERLLPETASRAAGALPTETLPVGTPRGTVALLEGCVQALPLPGGQPRDRDPARPGRLSRPGPRGPGVLRRPPSPLGRPGRRPRAGPPQRGGPGERRLGRRQRGRLRRGHARLRAPAARRARGGDPRRSSA